MDRAAAAPKAYRIEGAGPERRISLPLLAGLDGLVHAFTTSGSDAERVVAAVAGRRFPFRTMRQVHGAGVHVVDEDAGIPPGPEPDADALITRRRGVALVVRVADCVPILLADPSSGWIAAVHAGWRGTAAGVLAAALRAMIERGAMPEGVRVTLGPAIGACCFEVGPEVVEALLRFDPGAGACVVPGSRQRVDLVEANRRQALALGVEPGHVAAVGLCTVCRPDLLESYRRSRGAPGRMAGLIAWKA
jgi:purine-nucleoside/S-methyl-5'-thioadenosine phosphorylase / adenosine deaminase